MLPQVSQVFERVCAENSSCCNGAWDSTCVALADDLCGNTCQCPTFGDFDDNGAIDLADLAWFQRCFTGPDGTISDSSCACGDAAGNGDIDLVDFKAFHTTFHRP